MKMLKMPKAVLYLMVFTLFGPLTYAQDAASGSSKWEFHIIPYFWMAGIDGDATVKGVESDVDLTFSDISENLDFGGQFHLEAWKGGWGIFLDPTFLKLSDDADAVNPTVGPVEADITVEQWLVEFGGFYRFGKWPVGKDEGSMLSLDALGGGRYWYLKSKLDAAAPLVGLRRKVEESKDWIDPFLGSRLRADLPRKFSLVVRGDIGGFGVGSDFSWNTSAVLGYQFSRTVSAWLGYRVLGADYESGSGSRKFTYDVTMSGPIIGLGFRF